MSRVWPLGVDVGAPSLTPCCPELAAGLFQCLWKRCGKVLRLSVRDAETHPPGAPGVRRGLEGEGQGCQAGFCFNPTSIPCCSPTLQEAG